MTRISNKYGAINLSQGFPDFDPPKVITNRLAEIANVGPHQYAITWGAQNFREALAKKQSHWTGLPIDADRNIVVTCGSTEAMMAALMTVVNPAVLVDSGLIVLLILCAKIRISERSTKYPTIFKYLMGDSPNTI